MFSQLRKSQDGASPLAADFTKPSATRIPFSSLLSKSPTKEPATVSSDDNIFIKQLKRLKENETRMFPFETPTALRNEMTDQTHLQGQIQTSSEDTFGNEEGRKFHEGCTTEEAVEELASAYGGVEDPLAVSPTFAPAILAASRQLEGRIETRGPSGRKPVPEG